MSYEIMYKRAFIKINDEQYVPLINSGSNNCFEVSYSGREVNEMGWHVMSYPFHQQLILSLAQLKEAAKACDNGMNAKSRNVFFAEGEFERWYMSGIKTAHTVEEYSDIGKVLEFYIYEPNCKTNTKQVCHSTQELLDLLAAHKDEQCNIRFLGNRDIAFRFEPKKLRRKPVPIEGVCFILYSDKLDYFFKKTRVGIQYTPCSWTAKRFKTKKEAERYIAKYTLDKPYYGYKVQEYSAKI